VIRIADVTELLLSNNLFTKLVTKIQFYYFERSECDLLIQCLLKFMFETASVISLASFSLEQDIFVYDGKVAFRKINSIAPTNVQLCILCILPLICSYMFRRNFLLQGATPVSLKRTPIQLLQ